jgi:hypothetical protein
MVIPGMRQESRHYRLDAPEPQKLKSRKAIAARSQ